MNLTEDLFRLRRKHTVMLHKLQYELLIKVASCLVFFYLKLKNIEKIFLILKEITEQKSVLLKNHSLLENHLNSTYNLKQKHLGVMQK